MNSGRVSVVIPAFNVERFIAEAAASALAQGESVREVIVIDDGSSDGTAEAAQAIPGVTLRRQPNGGIGAARNAGVAEASGELLAFLDADDVWPEGRLARMLERLDSGADAVFGRVIEFGEGRPTGAPAVAQLASTMLIRRSVFDRVGTFREDVKVGEFIDWWARAEEANVRAIFIDEVVLHRRIHDTNTGIVQAGARQDYVRVLRAALERRRSAN